MWTYIVGPFLAFLPKEWRKALPFSDAVNWPRAVTLSGLAEMAVALVGLLYWYSISLTTRVNRGLEVAMSGKAGARLTDPAIGPMATVLRANNPLPWLLGYLRVDSAGRTW